MSADREAIPWFYTVSKVAVALAVVVIILGAFTRLVDAGLGCPDWPTCYGHVMWPETADEIDSANQAFPGAPVEVDKTWPEMVHRYFATTIGMFCIGLAVMGFRHRAKGTPFKLPLFLLAFVILQGAFGAWTVTLKLWPQVVTGHLLGGFTTLSLLWLLVLRLRNQSWRLSSIVFRETKALQRFAAIGLLVVIIQIALGGWTTSNYAALACPELPTCQGQWIPEMDFKNGFNIAQEIGPNYLGGTMTNESRVAIHMSHRIGAIVTTIVLLALVLSLVRIQSASVARMGKIVFAVLVLQVALGLSNVFFLLPLAVAVSHNAVGAMLLLCLVSLNYFIYTAKPQGL